MKRYFKKLITCALACTICLSVAVPAFAAESKSELTTAAAYLREKGIMVGDENGDMMLDRGLTRAHLAALLTRIMLHRNRITTPSSVPLPMSPTGRRSMSAIVPPTIWWQATETVCTVPMILSHRQRPVRSCSGLWVMWALTGLIRLLVRQHSTWALPRQMHWTAAR